MLRHAIYVRYPGTPLVDLEKGVEAILVAMERYGLGFRRLRWSPPPAGARYDVQTLADLVADDLAFACGACDRTETHKRRHLMDRYGSFVPTAKIPRLLTTKCGQRQLHGDAFCRFDFIERVRQLEARDIKWTVPNSSWRGRVRL